MSNNISQQIMSLSKALDQAERTQTFNEHLSRVPMEWRGPIVDVVDTFHVVKIGLQSIDINDSSVLVEAVRMVFERYDAKASREDDK